jgi:Protein of unknown function (DUF2752)
VNGLDPPLLISATGYERRVFGLLLPSAAEWWQSLRWVLIVFTVLIGLALSGSFVSYQGVLTNGHPWLPRHYCPGCPFCGMTRSFCAMSSGEWRQAWQWNRGGPALYTLFWIWIVAAFVYVAYARRLNRRVVFLPAISLALLTASSCNVREPSLFRLVPRESAAVLSVDWSSIRVDEALRRVIKADQFEAVLQRLGVQSEAVNTVTIFSTIGGEPVSGLLLRGRFDATKVVERLKTSGWTENSLDGHKVYLKAADYVAIPANKTLFAGTREGALAVFRAADAAEESIVTSEGYKKIDAAMSMKDKPVKAFLLIPEGTLEMADAALAATSFALSLFNLGGVGQLLQAANVARGFAFDLEKSAGERYPVEVCVLLRDEESARFVSGSLNTLKTISEAASLDTRDQESLRALRQMSIVRKDEVLAVRLEMPAKALFPPSNR